MIKDENAYNDEECKLTSIIARVYITSLNSHFRPLEPRHKMLG